MVVLIRCPFPGTYSKGGRFVVYEVDGILPPVGGRVHPSLPLYNGVIAQTQVGTDFLLLRPLACCR